MPTPKKYTRVSDVPSRRRAVPTGQTPRDTWITKTPDGKIYTFYSADDAQNFIDKNYSNNAIAQGDFGLVTIPEGDDIAPFILELPAVTIVGQKPTATPTRRGVDLYIGKNYSPEFEKAYNNLGMNPLKWPEKSGLLAGGNNIGYWDSDIHKAVNEGGNIAAATAITPLAAYTAPTWLPWLATPKGMLTADATLTAGFTANLWLPWLLGSGTLATIPAGQYIAENGVPSISLPLFGNRDMSVESAPTDSGETSNTADENNLDINIDDYYPLYEYPNNPDEDPDENQDEDSRQSNSNNQRRPSFRERLANRIAGRNRLTTDNNGTTPPNNKNGSFLKRLLWETRNNNFGQNNWLWRNVGRIGLLSSYPARENLYPLIGQGLKYMAVGPDSVLATTTTPADTTNALPVGFTPILGISNTNNEIAVKSSSGKNDSIIDMNLWLGIEEGRKRFNLQ